MITDAPRIVTSRLGLPDSFTLERYRATGGYDGLRKALSMAPAAVAAEVNKASLLGRGGAGFPAGRKWSMLRRSTTTYLVVNGDESEPATFKDHALSSATRTRLIEGASSRLRHRRRPRCSSSCGGRWPWARSASRQRSTRPTSTEPSVPTSWAQGYSVDIVVHPGAGAYICGEETALLESLEGKRGFPRIKPPYYPAAIGLYGEPTVVNNVETLSNLPWIVATGATPFPPWATGVSAGTRILALSGHVRRPGRYEIEFAKVSFRDLIYDPALGGGVRHDRELKAFIPGGVSAPWFGPHHLDLALTNEAIAQAGSMAGSGVGRSDGRDDVRGAGGLADNPLLPSGILRPVHTLPGGIGLDREGDAPHRGRQGREADLDLAHGRLRQHRPRRQLASGADDDLRPGAVDPSSVASGIRMFRDEFLEHIRLGHCPFPPDAVRRGEPRVCLKTSPSPSTAAR